MNVRPEKNARIRRAGITELVGVGYSYPSEVVTNEDFFARCRFPITNDRQGLVQSSRMKTRRWCAAGENTWTMARDAARMAVASSGIPPAEIDVVLVSSCSTIPRVNFPDPENPIMADLSPLLLKELGRDDAVGYDIKASYCSGFLRSLEIMEGLLENPNYRAGLLVASDQGGFFATSETNRSSFCFVVGDAAGAVVLRRRAPAPRVGLLDYLGYNRVSRGDLTGWGADGRSMSVKSQAAQVTLELLPDCARRLLARNHLSPAHVQWLLPMQTHAQLLDALLDNLRWPKEKLLWIGDTVGYAASASIPACLAYQMKEGVVRKGDLILSLAVGAGMNCAGALFYA